MATSESDKLHREHVSSALEEKMKQEKYWDLWKMGQGMLSTFHVYLEQASHILPTHEVELLGNGDVKASIYVEGRYQTEGVYSLVEFAIVGKISNKEVIDTTDLFTISIPEPDSSDYSQNQHSLGELEDAQRKLEFLDRYYQRNIPKSERAGIQSDHY